MMPKDGITRLERRCKCNYPPSNSGLGLAATWQPQSTIRLHQSIEVSIPIGLKLLLPIFPLPTITIVKSINYLSLLIFGPFLFPCHATFSADPNGRGEPCLTAALCRQVVLPSRFACLEGRLGLGSRSVCSPSRQQAPGMFDYSFVFFFFWMALSWIVQSSWQSFQLLPFQ